MDAEGIAQIITSLATLAAAIGAIIVGVLNSRRLADAHEQIAQQGDKLTQVHESVEKVAVETNGMKGELVAATRKGALAEGRRDADADAHRDASSNPSS